MSVLSIKVPIRKKSGNLFNDPRVYIYIYMCVCVCVCVSVLCVRVCVCVCVCVQDLAINKPQRLICHKMPTNQQTNNQPQTVFVFCWMKRNFCYCILHRKREWMYIYTSTLFWGIHAFVLLPSFVSWLLWMLLACLFLSYSPCCCWYWGNLKRTQKKKTW